MPKKAGKGWMKKELKLFKIKFEFFFELLNVFLSSLHESEKNVKMENKKWRNSNDGGRINWKT